jgi:very-short-patch-repair endonuclease
VPSRAESSPGWADPGWAELAQLQYLAISRAQLLAHGCSPDRIRWLVSSGRFQRLYPGVYLTCTGPVPWSSRLAGAVLYAGTGAALAGRTALALHRVVDAAPHRIELDLPESRRVQAQPGLALTSRRNLAAKVQPAPWPPRLRVEEAVLDVADSVDDESQVVALVLAAVQRRRSTPDRLRVALARRPRHRWRRQINEVIAESVEGVQSMLERRYLRDVERAHGLPRGQRQHRHRSERGSRYRDVRYRRWRVVVELDGAIAHPDHRKQRDDARNRGIVLAGDVPLVYGWSEVAGDPCGSAAEVGAVLTARGWRGSPHRCGPACRLPEPP